MNGRVRVFTPQQATYARAHRSRVLLLGTAGGPTWYPDTRRSGIASALVVNGRLYVIDCGDGAGARLRDAHLTPPPEHGLAQSMVSLLRAVFLTHAHSDHVAGYAPLLLYGWYAGLSDTDQPVQVFGPGRRGALPPVFPPDAQPPPVFHPDNPTPSTSEMHRALLAAHAADINERMRDGGRPDLMRLVHLHDIALPAHLTSSPDTNPAPPMSPLLIYQDENVQARAILVDHRPSFPAFAFRFDTPDGSVTLSGDTAPCDNLLTLATGTDVLVHEVIDDQAMKARYPQPLTPAQQASLNHLLVSHTSLDEVGHVAERAGAHTLVLSHIVPGDASPDRLTTGAGRHFGGPVIVGEDLMQIGLGQPRH